MHLEPMEQTHYEQLFEVQRQTGITEFETFMEFSKTLDQRSGFTIMDGANPVGCITFSDYVLDHDVTIHCSVLPAYQRRWIRRDMFKTVFDYCFVFLNVMRISGYCIEDYTDEAGKTLERLGFTKEGSLIGKILLPSGERHTLHLYSLLVNERKR